MAKETCETVQILTEASQDNPSGVVTINKSDLQEDDVLFVEPDLQSQNEPVQDEKSVPTQADKVEDTEQGDTNAGQVPPPWAKPVA